MEKETEDARAAAVEEEGEVGAGDEAAVIETDKEVVKPQVKVPTLYVRNLNDKMKIEGKQLKISQLINFPYRFSYFFQKCV